MGKRPPKRVAVFLVEGSSDRTALAPSIELLCEAVQKDIYVQFQQMKKSNGKDGGDITSDIKYNPNNILQKIPVAFLKDFMREYGLMPKDLLFIVQIVDVDGAYIPDESIESSEANLDKVFYGDNTIVTNNSNSIINRNMRKRSNLEVLINTSSIKVGAKAIPYSVYYFSSNMDHFLHNDANVKPQDKTQLAEEFSKKCQGNLEIFLQTFIDDPDATTDMTFEESWDYIKCGHNSINRHTNLNILLEKLNNIKSSS